jgi:hypothetical protein
MEVPQTPQNYKENEKEKKLKDKRKMEETKERNSETVGLKIFCITSIFLTC